MRLVLSPRTCNCVVWYLLQISIVPWRLVYSLYSRRNIRKHSYRQWCAMVALAQATLHPTQLHPQWCGRGHLWSVSTWSNIWSSSNVRLLVICDNLQCRLFQRNFSTTLELKLAGANTQSLLLETLSHAHTCGNRNHPTMKVYLWPELMSLPQTTPDRNW